MTDIGPQFDAERTPAEAENRDDELLRLFDRWGAALDAHWGEWRAESHLMYEFDAGRQWTDEESAEMEENGRIPVVFNLTAPTTDAVSGAEIQNRQQAQFLPREEGDTGVNDALTQGAEYITDECNGDQEDSQAFRDTLVCGMGWTNTTPDVQVDEVKITRERIDPLEMSVDPTAKKACCEGARYLRREIPMSRDEFDDFKAQYDVPAAEGDDGGLGDTKRVTIVDPSQRYRNGMLGAVTDEDEVIVCEWQWWEKVPVYLTALPSPEDPNVTKLFHLDAEQFGQARELMPDVKHTRSSKKVYYRAYVAGGSVLMHEPLKVEQFTYKAITGKRDRNKGTWFGLYRSMFDPQKFTNKLYAEVLHIIRTNAKGGLMMEEGAVKDQKQFEDTYALADAITYVKDGSLAGPNGPRVKDKVAPPIPAAIFTLMEWARDMVRACSGVNEEILGMVQREQAGVLEYQRKQAAYGLLSPYFDAKRRYNRDSGKLTLATMREYMPADQLVRIAGPGSKQYVKLALLGLTQQYDVIVDEAPAGPNQKARNMQVLTALMPWLSEADLDSQFWAEAAEYTDFTAAFAEKLSAAFKRKGERETAQGQAASEGAAKAEQIQGAVISADLENKNADTDKKRADAFKTATEAHLQHAEVGAAFAEGEDPKPQEFA